VNNPILLLIVTFAAFCFFSLIGCWLWKRATPKQKKETRDDLKFVLGGTLTLLALIIGFTFSMAITRYDQRKNLEEEEANAIGTEYTRAALMSDADAANVRSLLTNYLALRIDNYRSRGGPELRKIDAQTAELQTRMMAAVIPPAKAQPTQIMALVVSGMNDVLNSQGYTQATWLNRILIEAWVLMWAISIVCNLMTGYSEQERGPYLLVILPLVLSNIALSHSRYRQPARRIHPRAAHQSGKPRGIPANELVKEALGTVIAGMS
jgi:hypothetical protein